jgi:hypothetical protein
MPFANLRTFLRLHPEATITKVDHTAESIFFDEKGRQWVMIFTGTEVEGVWDMTPADDNWVQDQQERRAARSVGACFGGWKA